MKIPLLTMMSLLVVTTFSMWTPFGVAHSQTQATRAPAPDVPSIVDEFGINLRSGMVSRNIEIGRIGTGVSAEQSVATNVYLQFAAAPEDDNVGLVSRLNQEHTLQAGVTWVEEFGVEVPDLDKDFTVSTIGGTDPFDRSTADVYTRERDGLATLTPINGNLNVFSGTVPDYEYVTADGTIMIFHGDSSIGDGPTGVQARLAEKRKPDGEILIYEYGGLSWLNSELSTVTSNLGYQYRRGDNNALINQGTLYCDPAQADCTSLPNPTGGSFPNETWPNGHGHVQSRGGTVTNFAGDTTNFAASYTTEGQQYTVNGPVIQRAILDELLITDPEGIVTKYVYDFKNIVNSQDTVLSGYDTKVEKLEVHYAAQVWVYNFIHGTGSNSWSQVTITAPTGDKEYFEFDAKDNLVQHKLIPSSGNGDIVTNYEYIDGTTANGYGLLKKIIYPEGNEVLYSYDSSGRTIEVRKKAKTGSSLPDMVTSYTYAACNSTTRKYCAKPLTVTNERGLVTTYTYSSVHGGLLTVAAPWASGGHRHKTKIEYGQFNAWYRTSSSSTMVMDNRPVWRVTKEIACTVANANANCTDGDPNSTVTEYAYQQGNATTPSNVQLVSTTVRSGDSAVSQTSGIGHNTLGQVRWIDGPVPGTSDRSWFEYDNRNAVTLTTNSDPDGSGPQKHTYSQLTYNDNGQPTAQESGWVDNYQGTRSFTKLGSTSNEYDQYGRIQKVTRLDPAAGTVSITQTSYDASSRISCVALRMTPSTYGSLPGSACTQSSVGKDRITQTGYDAYGRAYKTTRGLGTTVAMSEEETFTSNGLRATIKDGKNNLTTYEYDGHDRLSKTRFPNITGSGSSTTDYEQLTYVVANGLATSLTDGRRHRDGQWINFTYDALDRVTFADAPDTIDDITTTYDVFGNIATRSKNGQTLTSTWDALGRMVSEQGPLGTVSYLYDTAGRRTRTTYPGGLYVTYSYTGAGGLDLIRENGATTLADYDYDAFNRTTLHAMGNGIGSDVAYDTAGRVSDLDFSLPAATSYNQQVDFGYNPASQITLKTLSNNTYLPTITPAVTNYTINGLNQIATVNGTTFTHDARGNLTNDGAVGYSYNIFNQLTGITGGSSFSFDPAGRLYEITDTSGSKTRFLYDGVDLIAEYDGNNQLIRRYVHGPGLDAPLVWYEGATVSNTTRRYLVPDERGSIVLVTNDSGGVVQQNRYDSYGIPDAANLGRFQYTGQIWLDDAGLYHYKARAYNPRLGRFMQTDPIGYGDGLNWYTYVGNDPINGTDPLGLKQENCGHQSGEVCNENPAEEENEEELRLGKVTVTPSGVRYADDISVSIRTAGRDRMRHNRSRTERRLRNENTARLRREDLERIEYQLAISYELANAQHLEYMAAAAASPSLALGGGQATAVGGSMRGIAANPFFGKSAHQISQMLIKRGYIPKGANPLAGRGTFVHARTGRRFHLDLNHPQPKGPHVGMIRPRAFRHLPKRDFPTQ